MLAIPATILEPIVRHAHAEHPLECCGLVAISSTGDLRHIEMINNAKSETFFEFEPKEQLKVWRELAIRNEELFLIYHSHTHSKPYPSHTDLQYAKTYPGVYQLIISTDARFTPAIRCYHISESQVEEVLLN